MSSPAMSSRQDHILLEFENTSIRRELDDIARKQTRQYRVYPWRDSTSHIDYSIYREIIEDLSDFEDIMILFRRYIKDILVQNKPNQTKPYLDVEVWTENGALEAWEMSQYVFGEIWDNPKDSIYDEL